MSGHKFLVAYIRAHRGSVRVGKALDRDRLASGFRPKQGDA
jgi:hypothetical protein